MSYSQILLRRTASSVLATALLCMSACGTLQQDLVSQADITPQEQAAFQEGKKALDSGDPTKAERLLNEFWDKYPNSRLIPHASMFLGKIAYERGNFPKALSRFAPYLASNYSPLLRLRANQWTGAIQKAMGNLTSAHNHYQTALGLAETDNDRRTTLWSLVQLALDQNKFFEAVQHLPTLVSLTPESKARQKLKQRTVNLIFLNLDLPEIELLMQQMKSSFPAGYLAIRRAQQLINRKEPKAARIQLAQFLKNFGNHPLKKQAQKLVRSIEEQKTHKPESALIPIVPLDRNSAQLHKGAVIQPTPPTASLRGMKREKAGKIEVLNVGILLPLSGPNAEIGQAGIKGIQLALQHAGAFSGRVKLQIRNSLKGDIVRTIKELVQDFGTIAILGPYHPSATSAATKIVEKLRIPIILPMDTSIGTVSDTQHVFRLGMSHAAQAEAVANYAVQTLGLNRLAILYPSNATGKTMSEIFHQRVAALGARIIRKSSYPSDATDFGRQIRALGGMTDQEVERVREANERRGNKPTQIPNIPFEGLFIPDVAAQAALIIPGLGFYNIRGIHLLGISGWNSNEIIALAKKEVEGAYFVGGYSQLSPTARRARFARDFQRAFSKLPNKISALSYDSMRFLLTGIRKSGNNRTVLRKLLSKNQGFDGVTGNFRIDSTGAARRNLPIMTINNGKISLAGKKSISRQ